MDREYWLKALGVAILTVLGVWVLAAYGGAIMYHLGANLLVVLAVVVFYIAYRRERRKNLQRVS